VLGEPVQLAVEQREQLVDGGAVRLVGAPDQDVDIALQGSSDSAGSPGSSRGGSRPRRGAVRCLSNNTPGGARCQECLAAGGIPAVAGSLSRPIPITW
jgi:hypothetical protein